MSEARQNLDRLYGALRDAGVTGAAAAPDAEADVPAGVLAALEDDLNTPLAVGELLGVARSLNASRDDARACRLARSLRAGGALLGLLESDPQTWFARSGGTAADDLDAAEIDSLLAQRDAFRRDRNYREADRIRDRLAERGVVIEDKPDGARWRRVTAPVTGVSAAAAAGKLSAASSASAPRDEAKR